MWTTKIKIKTNFRSAAILLREQVLTRLGELGVEPGDVSVSLIQEPDAQDSPEPDPADVYAALSDSSQSLEERARKITEMFPMRTRE